MLTSIYLLFVIISSYDKHFILSIFEIADLKCCSLQCYWWAPPSPPPPPPPPWTRAALILLPLPLPTLRWNCYFVSSIPTFSCLLTSKNSVRAKGRFRRNVCAQLQEKYIDGWIICSSSFIDILGRIWKFMALRELRNVINMIILLHSIMCTLYTIIAAKLTVSPL